MKHFLSFLLLFFYLFTFVHADDDKPLRVVYFDNYAPYSWLDDDGNMRGVFIDILDTVIGEKMDRSIEHIGLPWARAQQYIRNGEYDAMVAPITRDRRGYADISQQPVLNSRMAFFTYSSHPRMNEFKNYRALEDLKSFNFITQIGDGWAQEHLQDMEVLYVRDLNTVLKLLGLGRADLFVEASLVAHWNLKQLDLSKKVTEVEDVTIEITPFHLMVSKKSTQNILADFDKHMQAFVQTDAFGHLLEQYKQ